MKDDALRSYAQSGEDLIIFFLARHILHLPYIYYLDLGANHPTQLNNTHLFYEEGFQGVSVDANPYFEHLFKTKRPKDKFINCGVGTKNGSANFYEIEPHTLSTFSEAEARRYSSYIGHRVVKKSKKKIYTVETIIIKYCEKVPNILSLDVEGLDFDILQSINFNKWSPDIVCVETLEYTNDNKERKVNKIIDYLKERNYKLYADTYINSIFVLEDSWIKR